MHISMYQRVVPEVVDMRAPFEPLRRVVLTGDAGPSASSRKTKVRAEAKEVEAKAREAEAKEEEEEDEEDDELKLAPTVEPGDIITVMSTSKSDVCNIVVPLGSTEGSVNVWVGYVCKSVTEHGEDGIPVYKVKARFYRNGVRPIGDGGFTSIDKKTQTIEVGEPSILSVLTLEPHEKVDLEGFLRTFKFSDEQVQKIKAVALERRSRAARA